MPTTFPKCHTHIHQVANDERPAFLGRPGLLLLEKVKLTPEGEEVGKERVEVSLAREMEEDGVVGVVEVGKDAEELGVDVPGDRREVWRELAPGLCGEDRLVLDESLDPGEDVVDVLRRGQFDPLARGVDPGVVHPAERDRAERKRSRHDRPVTEDELVMLTLDRPTLLGYSLLCRTL